MKDITLKELHNIYYRRFNLLHRFLTENNIQYYAIGGTALGAVRHDGIIPWDEDIDIAMTRENYNRFLKICDKLDKQYFKCINYHNDKHACHPLTKIALCGVRQINKRVKEKYSGNYYIDVFPLDNIYRDERKQKQLVKRINRLKRLLYFKERTLYSKNLIRGLALLIIKACLIFVSPRYLCKRYDILASKPTQSNDKNKDMLWTSGGVYVFEKELHSTKTYGKPKLHKFGNGYIFIPEDFNQFLIDTYGTDYMTPYYRSKGVDFKCCLDDQYEE